MPFRRPSERIAQRSAIDRVQGTRGDSVARHGRCCHERVVFGAGPIGSVRRDPSHTSSLSSLQQSLPHSLSDSPPRVQRARRTVLTKCRRKFAHGVALVNQIAPPSKFAGDQS